jgi:hypothetical protein
MRRGGKAVRGETEQEDVPGPAIILLKENHECEYFARCDYESLMLLVYDPAKGPGHDRRK